MSSYAERLEHDDPFLAVWLENNERLQAERLYETERRRAEWLEHIDRFMAERLEHNAHFQAERLYATERRRAEWLEHNDRFLADALADLRRRLEELAAERHSSEPAVPEPTPPAPDERSRRGFGGRRRPVAAPLTAAPGLPHEPIAAILDEAPEAVPSTPATAPPPPLLALVSRLGLSSFERDVLLLCTAMELDTRISRLCADAMDPQRPFPTFALALALFPDATWDALSPDRPLRYLRLIEIESGVDDVVITSRLRADERIIHYIKGLDYLEDRLRAVLGPTVPADAGPLAPSQVPVAKAILEALRRPLVVQLLGASTGGKRGISELVSAAADAQLFDLPSDAFPTTDTEIDTLSRLLSRESVLQPITIFIDVKDLDRSAPQYGPLRRWLATTDQVVFLDTLEPWPGLEGLALEVGKPTSTEQRDAWREELPAPLVDQAAGLSGQFNLELQDIRRIAAEARARYVHPAEPAAEPEPAVGEPAEGKPVAAEAVEGESASDAEVPDASAAGRLWDDCLQHARPAMDQLAQRVIPLGRWDDLQLPDAECALLREIAAQVGQRSTVYDEYGFREKLNRGLGISVLFAGQPGTGKSLAAEVLANELRLLLYRIDLSAVVSKYIGETEKNLRRLFDAADDGGAILFFDEADALFGKRSEVKDSHDRYANIEINYLLQRMENYRGLAVLATNRKGSIDTAFLRRLRFIVDFPFPGAADRKRIWTSIFPERLDVGGLDLDRLAALDLTGGSISNIALNSAFRAADAGGSIDMPTVLAAARAEFRKLNLPVNEADFRWAPPTAEKAAAKAVKA